MAHSRRTFATCLGLALAVIGIYGLSLGYDFINFDDLPHLVENPRVATGLTGANLAWDFGIHGPRHWHPLTWLSHQTDFALFGRNAGLHRAGNVGLHAASAILLFLTWQRLTGRWSTSAFVAAAFAVHPLNVESVVWISERSNVLCGTFWMATLWWYERYARRPHWSTYSAVVLCHAAALMSKPLAVTLPCTLLLLDYWPLQRLTIGSGQTRRENTDRHSLSRILIEKLPLFALSAGASILALLTQQAAGAVHTLAAIPLSLRLGNTLASYGWYLLKTAWPSGLTCFYPHPVLLDDNPWVRLSVPAILAACALAGITIAAVACRRRHPGLSVGWFWFLGVMVPMIGLVQIGSQQLADRYAYLPIVGLSIVACACSSWRYSRPAAIVLLCGWGFVAQRQTTVWQNDVALYAHAVDVNPGNHWAHSHLGAALMNRGDSEQAMFHFHRALSLVPGSPLSHYHLGIALQDLGQADRALPHLRRAVELNPFDAISQQRLGIAFAEQGNHARAISHLQEAIRLAPENASSWFNLGLALANANRIVEAVDAFERSRQLQPDDPETPLALAMAQRAANRPGEALATLQSLLTLRPDSAEGHFLAGEIAREQGDLPLARNHFRDAVRLRPDWHKAREALQDPGSSKP